MEIRLIRCIWHAAFGLACLWGGSISLRGQSVSSTPESMEPKWWKEAIVYQIYPRSFKDSDGDGIGDLRGIISKLDYIKSLGVNVVWLNPIFDSPNDDNGYDVSDYRSILKEFGTMADFDSLVKGMHDRGIRVVMDLVVNHSSDEHRWFRESRSSRNNPFRNYYHWWSAENGTPPHRYSFSDVHHDAWTYDSLTKAYYLHYFSRKQPDLNWENPQLRKEVYDIMKFWVSKGIDGFRLDAFQYVAKDTTFPAFPPGFEQQINLYYAMQGNLHGYLQEMNKEVLSKFDVMSVAEGAGNTLWDAHNLVDAGRRELNLAYAFDAVDLGKTTRFSVTQLRRVFSRWDSAFASRGWLAVFLSNHDQARLVSRFGNDHPTYRAQSAKMLATLLLTMRGTPFVYYGDELGMTNPGFTQISDYRDQALLNEYENQKERGGDLKKFMEKAALEARDNGRTPMQWDNLANGGFTKGTPWIALNPNFAQVNVAFQEKDTASVLQYFRVLTRLRRENKALVYGSYALIDRANPNVYAFLRQDQNRRLLIALNFSSSSSEFHTGLSLADAQVLLCNYSEAPALDQRNSSINLLPYEALIIQLR